MDVGRLLDFGPWSTAQKVVLGLMALTIMFDGFDLLVLSFAIPALMKDWGVGRGGFATVLAVGLIAMSAGTALAGYMGDRLGRKKALLLSVLVFGAATLASAFAWDLVSLGVFRAVAGAGLGGAIPNAAAMSAEFTPLRRRPLAVSLTAVCVPLGGALAGFFAARILPVWGWPYLFALGGVAGLALAVLLVFVLPESPRFLVRRRERWPELRVLLERMGHSTQGEPELSDAAELAKEARGSWVALFGPAILRDTACLWVCFLSGMLAIYLALNWLPTLLAAKGWNLSETSAGLAAYNFGGVAGALICALLVPRWGSRVAMLVACGCAIASAGYLYTGAFGLAALAAHGLFANAVQSNLFSLAAHVYPTAARAFGVASAIALGRLGAVASAFAGAGLVQQGAAAYFFAIAMALVVTFAALSLLRDHIPRLRNEPPRV